MQPRWSASRAPIRSLLCVLVTALAAVLSTGTAMGAGEAPGSSCATASVDAPLSGSWTGGEPDCYTFDGTSGQRLLIALRATTSVAPARRVYRPNGSLACSSGAFAALPCVLDSTGTWRVETHDKAPTSPTATRAYQLTLHSVPSAPRCARADLTGRRETGTIRTGRPDCRVVTVGPQQTARITAKRSNATTTVRVLGGDTSPAGCTTGCAVGPGDWLVWIDGSGGDWSLDVDLWNAPECASIAPAEPGLARVTGTVRGAERACAIVSGNEGDEIQFAMQFTGGQAAGKQIRSRDGRVVCSSGAWSPLRCILPEGGEYLATGWYRPEPPAASNEPHEFKRTLQNRTEISTTGPRTTWCAPLAINEHEWHGTTFYSTPDNCWRVYNTSTTPVVLGVDNQGRTARVVDADGEIRCTTQDAACDIAPGEWATLWVGGRGASIAWSAVLPPGCAISDVLPLTTASRPQPARSWTGSRHSCLPVLNGDFQDLSLAVDTTSTNAPGKLITNWSGAVLCRSGAWAPTQCRVPRDRVVWVETWYKPAPTDEGTNSYQVSLRYVDSGAGCRELTVGEAISSRRAKLVDQLDCLRLVGGGPAELVVRTDGPTATVRRWDGPVDPSSPGTYEFSNVGGETAWFGGSPGTWTAELRRPSVTTARGISKIATAPGATDLQLASSSRGDAVAAWVVRGASGTQVWATVRRPSSHWEQPKRVSSSTAAAASPSVGIDIRGYVTAVWTETENGTHRIAASTRSASSSEWATPSTLSTSTASLKEPVLAVARNGRRAAVWRTADAQAFSESPSGVGAWTAAAAAPTMRGTRRLGLSDAGDVVMASGYAEIDDSLGLFVATRPARGRWSAASEVTLGDHPNYLWEPELAVAPDGTTILAHRQAENCFCNAAGVWTSTWRPGGTWTAPELIVSAAQVSDLSLAIDASGTATLVTAIGGDPSQSTDPASRRSTVTLTKPRDGVWGGRTAIPSPNTSGAVAARRTTGGSVMLQYDGANPGIGLRVRESDAASWQEPTALLSGARSVSRPLVATGVSVETFVAWIQGSTEASRAIYVGTVFPSG